MNGGRDGILAGVVDALGDAVIVCDTAGTVIGWNRAAETLYGVLRAHAVGRPIDDVLETSRVGPDTGDGADSGIGPRQATWQGRLNDRPRIGDRTGVVQVVDVRVSEIRDADANVIGWLSIGRPAGGPASDSGAIGTDEARRQTELIQAQKMEAIGQLVSGVAHELNNPLAAIVAFSQLIVRDPRLPADMKADAGLLVQESDRTRRIVQNLLDFARQRPPERHPTQVRALVQSILDLLSYSIGAARVEVSVDISEDLPPVALDRAQIQQVLLNLTSNALQAVRGAPGDHRLVITGRLVDHPERGRMVRITIADDGPGVSPEHRDRLFVPFFTTKPPGEGTGLGLPVSFGIVAAHGGSLRYEPSPGDRGATFIVELPVTTEAAEREEAPASGRVERPDDAANEAPLRARVLVLDDEPSIRRFLAKALEAAGHDPLLAADGSEALGIVADVAVDVFLCDHRMAGLSGTEVYEAAVRIRPDLARRFVFMSGDVLNPELLSFATARRIGLLAKPFDLDSVGSTVREVLERVGPEGQERG
ncbi:MAG TPA: ATP-binding protein [Candidatus Limnocylindrales bacterium]